MGRQYGRYDESTTRLLAEAGWALLILVGRRLRRLVRVPVRLIRHDDDKGTYLINIEKEGGLNDGRNNRQAA